MESTIGENSTDSVESSEDDISSIMLHVTKESAYQSYCHFEISSREAVTSCSCRGNRVLKKGSLSKCSKRF